MSGTTARRFLYLIALPVPVCETDECPYKAVSNLLLAPPALELWWTKRRELGEKVAAVQAQAWRARKNTNTNGLLDQLVSELNGIATHIAGLRVLWNNIYASLVSGGSRVAVCGEFTPVWHTLHGSCIYEFSHDIADVATAVARNGLQQRMNNEPAPRMRVHCEASLVFESVALAFLSSAVKQQLATLAQLRNPTLGHYCVQTLHQSVGECTAILTRLLPLHFATLNGTETYLMSPHFYTAFIVPLLEAQCAYTRAVSLVGKNKQNRIYPAAQFAKAARALRCAARTPYCDAPEMLEQLLLHRHASCALILAALFYDEANGATANKHAVTITYTQSPNDTPHAAEHSLLTEALACVRVAALLLDAFPPVTQLMQKIIQSIHALHGVFISLPQTDIDVPRGDAAVAAEWRRSVQIEAGATGEEDEQPYAEHIACNHRVTRASTIDLSTLRSYTIYAVQPCIAAPTPLNENSN